MSILRKQIEWLYGELPGLVSAGVLTPEGADGLRAHYGPLDKRSQTAWVFLMFGILGALLIGGGIILLFAHNWAHLSRPQRAAISYLPLLAGIGLGVWVILNRLSSPPWCESTAGFLVAGIGASIALVSQTYHIMTDMEAFLLVWILLALPLVYLLNSSLTAGLVWIGLFFWVTTAGRNAPQSLLYWPLAAAILPHLWLANRQRPGGGRVLFLCWILGICVCILPGCLLEGGMRWGSGWPIAYSACFALLVSASVRWEPETGFWRRPLGVIGTLGVLFIALLLSFEDYLLHGTRWVELLRFQKPFSPSDLNGALLTLLIPGAALGLLILHAVRGRLDAAVLGALPVLAVAACSLSPSKAVGFLFSLYLFGLGAYWIFRGYRAASLRRMNGGLALLALVLVARFFDSDYSMVVRGLVFIAVGIGFLALNVRMLRRRGGAA